VCNTLSLVHFLSSFPPPPPTYSSSSNPRKEGGQPVSLCGLYSYGMLLLKEHSCIAVRQICPPTRVRVCSLWVARLYSLKTTNTPSVSQINYQQACSSSTLSTCSFCTTTRIFFFSVFAICRFNELRIIPALKNITWTKRGCQETLLFTAGQVHYQV